MTQGNIEPVAWRWKYKKDTKWSYSPNEQTGHDPAVFEQRALCDCPSEQISGEAVERVTEAMVNRAHAEYHKVLGDPNRSDPMRAALEAAIGARHE